MSTNEAPVNGHTNSSTGSVGYLTGSLYNGMIVINQSGLATQFQFSQPSQSASTSQRQAAVESSAKPVSLSSSQGNV